jgi:hypothetical protein
MSASNVSERTAMVVSLQLGNQFAAMLKEQVKQRVEDDEDHQPGSERLEQMAADHMGKALTQRAFAAYGY